MVIGATMAAVVARPSSIAALSRQKPGPRSRWVFSPLAFSSSPTSTRKLVLYSKPGCCLCDGLKEKLQAAFLLSGPDSLHDVDLRVRDITTNPEWEKAYQYEIPVLAKVLSDGTEVDASFSLLKELISGNSMLIMKVGMPTILNLNSQETLPRLSPRIGVELVQKKIAAALQE